MEVFVLQLAGGLLKATFLFLLAAGLSLIFGVTRVINLAHGVFYMLGAYLAYTVSSGLEGSPIAFWVALLVAPLLVAALGGLIEVVLLRRVYGAGELYVALLTFSLILIGDELVRSSGAPTSSTSRGRRGSAARSRSAVASCRPTTCCCWRLP